MRLRISDTRISSGPSETVVLVTTSEGTSEEVIVDRRTIEDGTIEIGYPVGVRDDEFLVELPRETMRGTWRVWVARDQLVRSQAA